MIQPGVRTTAKALYEAYTSWCQRNGEQVFSQHRLGERLMKKELKRVKIHGIVSWVGVGITGG